MAQRRCWEPSPSSLGSHMSSHDWRNAPRVEMKAASRRSALAKIRPHGLLARLGKHRAAGHRRPIRWGAGGLGISLHPLAFRPHHSARDHQPRSGRQERTGHVNSEYSEEPGIWSRKHGARCASPSAKAGANGRQVAFHRAKRPALERNGGNKSVFGSVLQVYPQGSLGMVLVSTGAFPCGCFRCSSIVARSRVPRV